MVIDGKDESPGGGEPQRGSLDQRSSAATTILRQQIAHPMRSRKPPQHHNRKSLLRFATDCLGVFDTGGQGTPALPGGWSHAAQPGSVSLGGYGGPAGKVPSKDAGDRSAILSDRLGSKRRPAPVSLTYADEHGAPWSCTGDSPPMLVAATPPMSLIRKDKTDE